MNPNKIRAERKIRRFAAAFTAAAMAATAMHATAADTLTEPAALNPAVFDSFAVQTPVPALVMPAVRDYIGFSIGLLKVFGLAFQLPLVLVLLNRVGILSRERVVKMRRYAIVIIVIAAAILTPPDIVSQILLALPMWGLFELSILFMKK